MAGGSVAPHDDAPVGVEFVHEFISQRLVVLRWNVAKGVFKGQQFFFRGENLPSVGCVVNRQIDTRMLWQRLWNAFEDGCLHAPHILIHDSTSVWMSLRLVL